MRTMHRDSRGRVRFTENGIRYEINKHKILRAYRRYKHGPDTERAMLVSVRRLSNTQRARLEMAIVAANAEY